MKNLLFTLLFTLGSFMSFAQGLIWSEPMVVASDHGNLRPRLALTTGDIPVVVWGGGFADQPVYVSRWNGTSFSEPLAVSPDYINPYCTSWVGPDIAASGNDVWVVVDAEIGNDFRVYSIKSTDGGISFGDTVNVGGYSGITRFAAIGVSPNGNPLVSFMEHDQGYSNPRYMVVNTNDGGASWETPVDASKSITGDDVCDCCPSEVVSDGTNQVLMFRNNDSNLRDMWATVSPDGGKNFTTGSDVDEAGWTLSACPSIGPDGFMRGDSVIMVWITGGYGSPNRAMMNSVSKFTGMGRANQFVDTDFSGKQDYPRVHGDDQVMGVVYQKYNGNDYDCYFSYSTDGTTQFQYSALLLNVDTDGSQINPDIIYSNGVFHFTWQDNNTGQVIYRTAALEGVGISENEKSEFVIFPNPAHGKISLMIQDGATNIEKIEVLDSYGMRVDEIIPVHNKNKYEIDLTAYPNGLFFVRIKTKNGLTTRKFLVLN